MLDLDCNKPFVFEKYTVLLIVKCTSVRGRKKSPTISGQLFDKRHIFFNKIKVASGDRVIGRNWEEITI